MKKKVYIYKISTRVIIKLSTNYRRDSQLFPSLTDTKFNYSMYLEIYTNIDIVERKLLLELSRR